MLYYLYFYASPGQISLRENDGPKDINIFLMILFTHWCKSSRPRLYCFRCVYRRFFENAYWGLFSTSVPFLGTHFQEASYGNLLNQSWLLWCSCPITWPHRNMSHLVQKEKDQMFLIIILIEHAMLSIF